MDIAKCFADYNGKKIAVYGLSTETEKALRDLASDFDVVGLLDGFRESGSLYGYPIISLDYAVKSRVELILVVARPGSCRTIARRIGAICRENNIALIDIRGKNLLEDTKVTYGFSGISGNTKAELREKIDAADVVSFDLFDTLVTRQTLFPEDIAEYVDNRLREDGILIPDFEKKRIESEKELSKDAAPALTEIYENMLAKINENDKKGVTANLLADIEWEIDYALIIPRKDVCEIFKQAVASGKKVYLVSDTYYRKEQLHHILRKCGIIEYTDILSSSDYGISKVQGLYEVLKNLTGDARFLHIGDDIVADIESAQKYGLETYRLYSGQDLLEMTGNMGFSGNMDSLSDRLKIGMFVSKIFNSPFQFESDGGQIEVADAYDVGYLICAPMISDFVLWFYEQVKQQKFRNIWFSARDGYLIQKMYSELLKTKAQNDDSVYFMTSRTAAIRAGIRNEADIRYVDDMHFSGSLKQNLKDRFGIDADDVSSKDRADDEGGLLRYKKTIMERSKVIYRNYQTYINRLCVKDGDVAFFDFVAKGTSQMYIQRLVHNQLKGFYFLRLEADHTLDKGLDIQSFYRNEESNLCAIYDDYYIFETLLTAPHPSVQEFDEYGQPVYAPETRSERDICCFKRAQEGILDYFKTYINLCPKTEKIINRKLDEVFLKLIHEIKITDSDFLNLVVEDPFFNRMTNITDVL